MSVRIRAAVAWEAGAKLSIEEFDLDDPHAQDRFPVDRLVKNYPFAEVNTVIADSLSGATIKPVLTF
jgi:Zn-dependent alcohol dehydrogenase